MEKTMRKPNGKKAPKTEAKTVKTEVKESKAKETKVKEPKITVAEKMAIRRDALKKVLKFNDPIQFETEKTAKKGDGSAQYIYTNALMLTKVEDNKATRIVEIWLHQDRVDLCISRKLFDSIAADNKEIEAYREKFTPTKLTKYVITLANDEETAKFVNLFVKNVETVGKEDK